MVVISLFTFFLCLNHHCFILFSVLPLFSCWFSWEITENWYQRNHQLHLDKLYKLLLIRKFSMMHTCMLNLWTSNHNHNRLVVHNTRMVERKSTRYMCITCASLAGIFHLQNDLNLSSLVNSLVASCKPHPWQSRVS